MVYYYLVDKVDSIQKRVKTKEANANQSFVWWEKGLQLKRFFEGDVEHFFCSEQVKRDLHMLPFFLHKTKLGIYNNLDCRYGMLWTFFQTFMRWYMGGITRWWGMMYFCWGIWFLTRFIKRPLTPHGDVEIKSRYHVHNFSVTFLQLYNPGKITLVPRTIESSKILHFYKVIH